jgi:type I restriction enzyme M protein
MPKIKSSQKLRAIDKIISCLATGKKRFIEIKNYLEELEGRTYAKGTIQKMIQETTSFIEKTLDGRYRLNQKGRKRLEVLALMGIVDESLMPKEKIPEKLTQQELEHFLWEAADILRGAVQPTRYKFYILPLLFYKRLSDVYEEEYYELLEKYHVEEIARKKFHRFLIPKNCSWEEIRKISKDIGEKLNQTLEQIAKENPELEGVINRTDFNNREELPEARLFKLMEHFSRAKLGNENVEPDVLGRAYEYLIKQFALAEARKGGEFYTPREVVRIMVEILDPKEGESGYDPCVGSAGMLIESHYNLERNGRDPRNLFLYGQELEPFTRAVAKMNVILHDLEAEILHGDTLADPKFLENGGLKKFDFALTNPMWNQDGYRDVIENDRFERFSYGVSPNNSADWGWIQHLLASLKPKGRAGIVLDQGSLFRGASEEKIRKKIIEADLIECVVALPEKIFYNTGAPGCLIFFNKNKSEKRKNKILFVYAAKEFEKLKNMNRLRKEDINRAIEARHRFEGISKYASVVPLEKVKENDYNLSVTRYVNIFEEEKPVNISQVLTQLKDIEKERKEVERKLKSYLEILGYDEFGISNEGKE